VIESPTAALRRLPPDQVQLQVILGSMLGGARIRGARGTRRLVIRHGSARWTYVRWKYERLGALADAAPRSRSGSLEIETIPHPLFDDLARLRGEELRDRLTPLGLAVWLCDVGRLELERDSFLPAQRDVALS